ARCPGAPGRDSSRPAARILAGRPADPAARLLARYTSAGSLAGPRRAETSRNRDAHPASTGAQEAAADRGELRVCANRGLFHRGLRRERPERAAHRTSPAGYYLTFAFSSSIQFSTTTSAPGWPVSPLTTRAMRNRPSRATSHGV